MVCYVLLALAIFAAAWLSYRAHRQRRNAAALAIRTPHGIDEGLFVRAGGIDQWINVRGEDRNNPVVLVLHGGPATSYMSFPAFFQPWEKHFTVVQWDRRGVGKTFGRNGRARSGEMTLDRIAADGNEVAEFVCRHLHKDKVILLGHSMGSMIGILMAARRPDLFHAYVGTEQIINMARNEEISYQTILERSRSAGNARTVKRLERIGAPPYKKPMDWGAKQRAAEVADPAYGSIAGQIRQMVLFSPSYSLRDILDFLGGSMFCISKLYTQWMAFDAYRLGTSFQTPIFIIEGENDVMTPSELPPSGSPASMRRKRRSCRSKAPATWLSSAPPILILPSLWAASAPWHWLQRCADGGGLASGEGTDKITERLAELAGVPCEGHIPWEAN